MKVHLKLNDLFKGSKTFKKKKIKIQSPWT